MNQVNIGWLNEQGTPGQPANCTEFIKLLPKDWEPITYEDIAASIGFPDKTLVSLSIVLTISEALVRVPSHITLNGLISNLSELSWVDLGNPVVHAVIVDHGIEIVVMKITNNGASVTFVAYSVPIQFSRL